MVKPRVPASLQAWIDARRRYHLSHAHVQMARELGMNPKKLGKVANHRQEPWKLPLHEFIESLYERRFGRREPERVVSIEERSKELANTKTSRQQLRAARRLGGSEVAGSGPHAPKQGTETTVGRASAQHMNVSVEAATIVACALAHEPRIIALGPLLFFSTETSDAWVLDPADHLAQCLMRDGARLPTGITETSDSFAVDWRGSYALDGDMFVVADHSGRVNTIIGYPIREIRRVMQLMEGG